MENPFDAPILALGLLSGIAAGVIRGTRTIHWINRIYILLLGACASWGLELLSVDWAYTHPFNPNDGASRAIVALFGWAIALINPIMPTFAAVVLMRMIYRLPPKSQSAT